MTSSTRRTKLTAVFFAFILILSIVGAVAGTASTVDAPTVQTIVIPQDTDGSTVTTQTDVTTTVASSLP